MNTENWIAILGVLVAILAIIVPALAVRSERRRADGEKLKAENAMLRETNQDLRTQLMILQSVGVAVNRTFSGLPTAIREGGTE